MSHCFLKSYYQKKEGSDVFFKKFKLFHFTYFVVITGEQFRIAFVDITTCSARKYSGAVRGSVELKGILNFGGEQGACNKN